MEHISIPIAGTVAWIPYRMPKEDYDLLMATLTLWESQLVAKPKPDEKQPENERISEMMDRRGPGERGD